MLNSVMVSSSQGDREHGYRIESGYVPQMEFTKR